MMRRAILGMLVLSLLEWASDLEVVALIYSLIALPFIVLSIASVVLYLYTSVYDATTRRGR